MNETGKQGFKVQVFAIDIDNWATDAARAGIYPASIAVDVAPDRLSRFFVPESDGGVYRIHKGIRDMMVFSEQDVIKDPRMFVAHTASPWGHSCRRC